MYEIAEKFMGKPQRTSFDLLWINHARAAQILQPLPPLAHSNLAPVRGPAFWQSERKLQREEELVGSGPSMTRYGGVPEVWREMVPCCRNGAN